MKTPVCDKCLASRVPTSHIVEKDAKGVIVLEITLCLPCHYVWLNLDTNGNPK